MALIFLHLYNNPLKSI